MLLSLFPQLLFLSPAGTAILRIAAAICFAYIGRDLFQRAHELSIIEIPLFGKMHAWMVQLGASASIVIAVLLFFGAWTQGIALVGALGAAKSLIFFRRYEEMLTFSRSTYWLLLCICLMLVVTGAGAFSFDLPL
jgi:uncharacterized membrane protein YphA (DoxX/SURF4 family)